MKTKEQLGQLTEAIGSAIFTYRKAMPDASLQGMSSWSANAHGSSPAMTGGKGEAHATLSERQGSRVFLSLIFSDEERPCTPSAEPLLFPFYPNIRASDIRFSVTLTVTPVIRA